MYGRSGKRPHSGVMGRRIIPGYTMYRTVPLTTMSGEIDDTIYEAIPLFRAERGRMKDPGNTTSPVATPTRILDDHHFPGKSGRLRKVRRTMFETFSLSGHSTILGLLAILLVGTLSKIRAIVIYSSGTIEVDTVVRRHSITRTNKIVPGDVKTSFRKKYLSWL